LTLHAEVKALQARFGLSYKDAAHRLYMSEVAKLRAEKRAEEAITSIRTRLDHTIVEQIFPPITRLDNEDFEFSDVPMEEESDSRSMHPVQEVDAPVPVKRRPSDCINLDECDDHPNEADIRGPGD
jgi:hypothetical protein